MKKISLLFLVLGFLSTSLLAVADDAATPVMPADTAPQPLITDTAPPSRAEAKAKRLEKRKEKRQKLREQHKAKKKDRLEKRTHKKKERMEKRQSHKQERIKAHAAKKAQRKQSHSASYAAPAASDPLPEAAQPTE